MTRGTLNWTNLIDEVQDLGQDADTFAVVDNVVVEVAGLLEYSALVQVGEVVHYTGRTKWPTVGEQFNCYNAHNQHLTCGINT